MRIALAFCICGRLVLNAYKLNYNNLCAYQCGYSTHYRAEPRAAETAERRINGAPLLGGVPAENWLPFSRRQQIACNSHRRLKMSGI